jgi:hypothetical protein
LEAIAQRLPPGTPALPKPMFGVAGVPEILDTLESIDRNTFATPLQLRARTITTGSSGCAMQAQSSSALRAFTTHW